MSEGHQEIIIIKRHGAHEEEPHGGAWKIALADFMTAMMALFLVMWLINSTSKDQKATIAEYFNPVKLAEVTRDKKGLRDPEQTSAETNSEGGGRGEVDGQADGKGGKPDASGAPGSRGRESALFQDPYSVLARLASEAEVEAEAASADASATEAGRPGMSGGEAARDPFDPLYWQVASLPSHRTERPGATNTVAVAPGENRVDARAHADPAARKADKVADPKVADPKAADQKAATDPKKAEAAKQASKDALKTAMKDAGVKLASADPDALTIAPVTEAKVDAKADTKSDAKVEGAPEPVAESKVDAKATAKDAPKGAQAKAAELPGKPATPPEPSAAETAMAAEIKAEIAKAVQPADTGAPAPRIEVRRSGEGILISVTDEINFSMFGIGSAEPTPKVVRALERIAKVLASRPGQIVVRGHTDGRPFRSETYDNWRLSSARAQMASYMLVRGGFDEKRVERIEGYADRRPRNTGDAKAAENRRIEILLRGQPE